MFNTLGEALDEFGVNSKSWAEKLHVSVPYFYSVIRKAERPGKGAKWEWICRVIHSELRIIPIKNGGWEIMTVREYIDDFQKRETEMNERLMRHGRKES